MTRRVAAIAAVVAAGILLTTTASAASFSDPTGDVEVEPAGGILTGLDITGVEVTNSGGERLTFRIALAGAPALPPGSVVAVVLDTDKNAATGDQGTEAIAALSVEPTGVQVPMTGLYDPSTREFGYIGWDESSATYSDGALVLSFPRFALNNPRGFTFAAVTVVTNPERTAAAIDVAPDSGPPWAYELVGLPPLLMTARGIGEPTRPQAGRPFTVTSEVRREDTLELVSRGRITCLVRIGDTRIRATGRFTGVGARCSMTIPRGAKGKTLRGTMTVQALGANVKRAFTFRVI